MHKRDNLLFLSALLWVPPLQVDSPLGLAWYWWVAIIVVLLILLLVWLVLQNEPGPPLPKGGVQPKPRPARPAPARKEPVRQAEEADAPAQPDDLKRIEGIGPKIAGMLTEKGISTFAQLADSNVAALQEMLAEAGLRMIDPETWPQQASLAAQGKWEEFERLTDELKGGRRVEG